MALKAQPVNDPVKQAWKQQLEDEVAFARRHRKPKRPVVITFGRFNPPTTGHARLIDCMRSEALRRQCPAMVFTSQRQDEDNPLPYVKKIEWLRKLFPHVMVCETPHMRTPMDVLYFLQMHGFDAVYLVVGSDQAASFGRLAKYVKPRGVRGGRFIVLKDFQVLSVPTTRNPTATDVAGMSATKLREAARAGKYAAFRRGVPTKLDRVARSLYYSVRRNMALKEGKAFLLYGTTLQRAEAFRQAFTARGIPRVTSFGASTMRLMEQSKPFYVDVSGHSYSAVRQLMRIVTEANYRPTIYMQEAPVPRQITEAWVKLQATYGLLRQLRRTVVVEDAACAVAHALREAEGGGVKTPTEADKLKTRQKQELLATQKRQSNDLFQAKERDLQQKSREDQQKLSAPKK